MAKEITIAREEKVDSVSLQNALRSKTSEEIRSAMMSLYTAQPNNKALIELGNQYAAELKRRGM